MNIFLLSLGCPKNLVDSEALSGVLTDAGYRIVGSPESAKIILISTCAFIRQAIEESIESILELAEFKKKGDCKRLIVLGCLVDRYKEQLLPLLPEVDAFIGLRALPYLASWLKDGDLPPLALEGPGWSLGHFLRRNLVYPHMAYVKIAEGCSNRCSFCTIPYIRGPLLSRPIAEIKEEVEMLVERGVKEIILVAQDTTSYGIDIYGKQSLNELIYTLDKIDGLGWLRILYVHPKGVMKLTEAFYRSEHLVPYLDFPIQHISDRILMAMGRGYRKKEVYKIIEYFRKNLPQVALRTSVMVGFPGEDKDTFNELVDFIRYAEFDFLGAFKYSREEGTRAFSLSDNVSEEEKENRWRTVMDIQREILWKKNKERLGTVQDALIEEDGDGITIARAPWQAPEIDNQIYIEHQIETGGIIKVRITDILDYDLKGVPLLR